jgi:hypothetical protein
MKRWLSVSLVFQFILAAYFQLILWFRLGAWNDQPGKSFSELTREGQAAPAFGFATLMVLPLLLFSLAFWKRLTWLMWLGAGGYGVWALLQIQSWWIPWFYGADQRALSNAKALERTFKIFPYRRDIPRRTQCILYWICSCLQSSELLQLVYSRNPEKQL